MQKLRLYDVASHTLKAEIEFEGPLLDCCFHDDSSGYGGDQSLSRYVWHCRFFFRMLEGVSSEFVGLALGSDSLCAVILDKRFCYHFRLLFLTLPSNGRVGIHAFLLFQEEICGVESFVEYGRSLHSAYWFVPPASMCSDPDYWVLRFI